MKRRFLLAILFLLFVCKGFSQFNFGCETTTAFPKNTTPDLGIVIYTNDDETIWNALRLATYSQSKGDTVVMFLIGKGIDPFMRDSSKFDIRSLQIKFLSNGGQIIVCGTCAKQRHTDEVKMCTIASIADLYEIVKRSKKSVDILKFSDMSNYVIVVAGGSGTRMKSVVPKQFLELAGKPVLMHTLERFVTFDPAIKIILVLPEAHQSTWKELCVRHAFTLKHSVVNGGETRFYSVKNGLNTIIDDGIVAVHDGVRPLVSISTIKRCFEEAMKKGNAIPCIPVHETMRQMEGDNSKLIDRSALRLVQTPQVFDVRLLQQAFNQEYQSFFTDDASVLENKGVKIHLVEGNRENIKITEPADLVLAKSIIEAGFLNS